MWERHGRDISMYDEPFLEKTLSKRVMFVSAQTLRDYLNLLAENGREAEELSRLLVIAYSEFFRNPLTFGILEQVILPALMQVPKEDHSGGQADHPEIRIWSAGCAAGQEAYSLAILLCELATISGNSRGFRIFATDRSGAELAAAKKGMYNASDVQNIRLKHLRAFFTPIGDRWEVIPRLRDHIDFSNYDLLDEKTQSPPRCIFGGFDLIFCSNLLFYYRSEIRQFVLKKMFKSLSPGGFFVTGEAERAMIEPMDRLRPIFPSVAIFQKNEG
ncbi:MAG: CheR family methyltransferase [Candidatus Ozemobacteraceae bacterium]